MRNPCRDGSSTQSREPTDFPLRTCGQLSVGKVPISKVLEARRRIELLHTDFQSVNAHEPSGSQPIGQLHHERSQALHHASLNPEVMDAMKDSQSSMLGLVVSPVLWGGNFLVGDMLADTLPGVWANLLRWVIALIVLAPFLRGRRLVASQGPGAAHQADRGLCGPRRHPVQHASLHGPPPCSGESGHDHLCPCTLHDPGHLLGGASPFAGAARDRRGVGCRRAHDAPAAERPARNGHVPELCPKVGDGVITRQLEVA